jgi:hypothetical protein
MVPAVSAGGAADRRFRRMIPPVVLEPGPGVGFGPLRVACGAAFPFEHHYFVNESGGPVVS